MRDSELALLALLAEMYCTSGYALAAAARLRGMERWAGLSPRSVYKGLRRLESNRFESSGASYKRRGKGPPGRLHRVTVLGAETLRRQLSEELQRAPEQSVRYRLALAFVELVGVDPAVQRLQMRSDHLERRIADVERTRDGDGTNNLGATFVFTYVVDSLKQEHAATASLVGLLPTWSVT